MQGRESPTRLVVKDEGCIIEIGGARGKKEGSQWDWFMAMKRRFSGAKVEERF